MLLPVIYMYYQVKKIRLTDLNPPALIQMPIAFQSSCTSFEQFRKPGWVVLCANNLFFYLKVLFPHQSLRLFEGNLMPHLVELHLRHLPRLFLLHLVQLCLLHLASSHRDDARLGVNEFRSVMDNDYCKNYIYFYTLAIVAIALVLVVNNNIWTRMDTDGCSSPGWLAFFRRGLRSVVDSN